jgi:predicted secreted protein
MVPEKISRYDLMKKCVFICTALLLFSCNKMQTVKINDAQPVYVKCNKKFRINLPEDHRSGYTWQLNDHDKSLVAHMNTVWEGNDNGVYFYFETIKPGLLVLNFTSRKYDDVNSIKEFSIKITEN